jgi:hypothetical protein
MSHHDDDRAEFEWPSGLSRDELPNPEDYANQREYSEAKDSYIAANGDDGFVALRRDR